MASLDDLSQRLQQFFAAKFPSGTDDGPGTVMLVFDSLGMPLSPDEFVGSGTDAAEDILAHQAAARLADHLPAANLLESGWYLAKAGSRLSTWYEQIVTAATATSADPVSIGSFEALKATAKTDLRQNQLVTATGTTIGGPGGTVDAPGTHSDYFATSMTPDDWYKEDTTAWSHYDLQAADQPAPSSPPSPPWRHPRFEFRVANDPTNPELIKFVAKAVIAAPDATATPVPAPDTATGSADAGEMTGAIAHLQKSRFQLAANRFMNVGGPAIALHDTFPATHGFATADTPVASHVGPKILNGMLAADTFKDHINPSDLQVMHIDPELAHDATTAETPTADNFEVSFDYCMVRFDRPWWAEVLLLSHQWKIDGYQPGDIASGSASHPTGPVTLITIGALVVRKLWIKAQWSDSDRAAIASATSLGPFCIAGADYDSQSGQISRDGVQVIAWLCQVPPVLPPLPA